MVTEEKSRREDLETVHADKIDAKDVELETVEMTCTEQEHKAVALQQQLDQKCREYVQQIELLDQRFEQTVTDQKEFNEKDNQQLLRSRAEHDNRLQAMLEQRGTCKREIEEIETVVPRLVFDMQKVCKISIILLHENLVTLN